MPRTDPVAAPSGNEGFTGPQCEAVAAINAELEDAVAGGLVPESLLDTCIAQIEVCAREPQPLYWLLIARVTEAALLQAGRYADNGEIQAAGDLLANPRKVRVYVNGHNGSFEKKRHGRISDQFNTTGRHYGDFIRWFSRNAIVEQNRPPILTELTEKMAASGCISRAYLAVCRRRMRQIADTIGFLMAWGIGCFEDLAKKRAVSEKQALQWLEIHFCSFREDWFERIGEDIRRYDTQGVFSSRSFPVLTSRAFGNEKETAAESRGGGCPKSR